MIEEVKQVLEQLVKRFEQFVITTDDGYSGAVQSANHILVGKSSVVVMDVNGLFEFIPFEHISRVSNKNGDTLISAQK